MILYLHISSTNLGLINDLTDSYNLAFYLAGIPPIISALIMFAVPSKGMVNRAVDQEVCVYQEVDGFTVIL